MATMVEDLRSGRFDLLLTGYSDRWQRNLLRRTLELLEDELHPNGVALVMCDRKILSSDPSNWDEFISEAAGADKYSRRLSERISEGYAAKFDQEHDPGGHAALGFRRLPEPPHTLEIDPDTMPTVVRLFERYALGNVSAMDLAAETGLAESRIRMIVMNPLYNGWVDVVGVRRRCDARHRGAFIRRCRTTCGRGRRTSAAPRRKAVAHGSPAGSTCWADCSSASAADGSEATGRSLTVGIGSSMSIRAPRGAARRAWRTPPGRCRRSRRPPRSS